MKGPEEQTTNSVLEKVRRWWLSWFFMCMNLCFLCSISYSVYSCSMFMLFMFFFQFFHLLSTHLQCRNKWEMKRSRHREKNWVKENVEVINPIRNGYAILKLAIKIEICSNYKRLKCVWLFFQFRSAVNLNISLWKFES